MFRCVDDSVAEYMRELYCCIELTVIMSDIFLHLRNLWGTPNSWNQMYSSCYAPSKPTEEHDEFSSFCVIKLSERYNFLAITTQYLHSNNRFTSNSLSVVHKTSKTEIITVIQQGFNRHSRPVLQVCKSIGPPVASCSNFEKLTMAAIHLYVLFCSLSSALSNERNTTREQA